VIGLAIWAFYLISCVKFDKEKKLIVKVGAHKDSEDGFGDLVFQKRDLIISNWKKGKSYMTLHLKPNGGFKQGDKIQVYTINGKEYIKVQEDDKEEDNLGEIPGCR
jgi:hypothetical protein